MISNDGGDVIYRDDDLDSTHNDDLGHRDGPSPDGRGHGHPLPE